MCQLLAQAAIQSASRVAQSASDSFCWDQFSSSALAHFYVPLDEYNSEHVLGAFGADFSADTAGRHANACPLPAPPIDTLYHTRNVCLRAQQALSLTPGQTLSLSASQHLRFPEELWPGHSSPSPSLRVSSSTRAHVVFPPSGLSTKDTTSVALASGQTSLHSFYSRSACSSAGQTV